MLVIGDTLCVTCVTIIVLVLLAFNFIPQRTHHSLTFTRSRLRDSATATLRPGDGTTTIKVEWSQGVNQLILFSTMEKNSEVYRRNNNGPKPLPCGTPDATLSSLLQPPTTITCCDRFDRNCVNTDNPETQIPTERIPRSLTLSNAALKSICTILANSCHSQSLCCIIL